MIQSRRTLSLLLAVLLSVFLPLHAADNRNDGNTHDTREGAENAEEETEGSQSTDSCSLTSPVLIKNREFVWSDTDIVLNGRPLLSLSRYYRSYDSREGIFGKGWNTRCEKALIRVLDYVPSDPNDDSSPAVARVSFIHRLANGRRFEFVETSPNVFATPDGLPGKALAVDAQGSPSLRNIDGSVERYNSVGKLEAEIDRNGNAVVYDYQAGVLSRIADENGRFLALSYDSTGHVSSVNDHTGRSWQYTYNSDGTLASVTNPAGGTRQYEYRLVLRDASNQPYQVIERIVDETGVDVISVTYAENGKVDSYTVGANTYTYSERRGFTYKKDSLNSEWAFAADDNGLKTEVFPPVNGGTPERYSYDEHGNVILYSDLAGTEFAQTYDALGRITSVTTPDGTSTMDYVDGKSWPEKLTSVTGREMSLAYDSVGNPTKITDPAGNASAMRWNAQGDLVEVTDALGNRILRTVDTRGLPTVVTDALERSSTYTYDDRGNLSSVTDAAGNVTQMSYDVLDRRTSVTDALGQTTLYNYDDAGRLLSLTDAAGGVTAFTYDSFGRQISETRPDGSDILYTHREDNLIDTMTDARGTVTQYTYDRGKRLTRSAAGSTRYDYTYDTLGRVTRATSGTTTVSFTYDSMHRPLSETQGRTTVDYGYNAEGELITMGVLGEERRYAYDTRGLLASMTTPSGTHGYEYDAAGRLVRHTLPTGVSATMRYDAAGQLIEQDYSSLTGDVLSYGWDTLGRVEQISGDGNADWLYIYDSIGRLVGAQHEQSYNYQYDALGNRLEDGGVYDAFNKLLENNNFSFTYDAAGALVSRVNKSSGEETRYGWDGMRRLASVDIAPSAEAVPTTSVTYTYDAYGRRVSKRVGRETTDFRWAGDDLIAEFAGSSTATAVYRYDGGYSAAEYSDDGGTYYVKTDHLDTAKSLVSDSGADSPVDRTDPYGALESPATTGPEFNQRFPGQYFDRETGLSYNRFRYYDPELGRYIKDDSLSVYEKQLFQFYLESETLYQEDSANKAALLNSYVYANSSPLGYIDVDGQIAFLAPVIPYLVGAAVGAATDIAFQMLSNGGRFECVKWSSVAYSAGMGAVGAQGVKWFRIGKEFKIGKNFRLAPFGNRTGHPIGRWPHYHRRGPKLPNGQTTPGQGIGRHRPFETKPIDRGWGDRF